MRSFWCIAPAPSPVPPPSPPPSPPSSPPPSRWRWRPGAALSGLVALIGGWLVVLNVLTAATALPFALHGRSVAVTISRCDATRHGVRTCRGSYTLGPAVRADEVVLGGDSARTGATVRATVDGRHPGEATTADPTLAVAEATVFALAGAAICAVGARSVRRAFRRRNQPRPPRGAPVPPADDDPLGWARRRRFGAGA